MMIVSRCRFALLLAGGLLLSTPAISRAQRKERDLITRQEIEESAQRDQDLFSVIRNLRPHFLQPPRGNRGSITSVPARLYVNGSREPQLEALRRISASLVEEVRYLEPAKAEMEYGGGASGGAIVVKIAKPEVPPPEDG